MMINNVTLTGRLTKDPELRRTQNGTAVTTITIAVDRPKSKNEDAQKVDYLNCVAWNTTAEIADKYLTKGSLIGIVGTVQARSYDNKDGDKVYVTEILINQLIMLGGNKKEEPSEQMIEMAKESIFSPRNQEAYEEITDDDLPF